mgnify:CR=1 FL=1
MKNLPSLCRNGLSRVVFAALAAVAVVAAGCSQPQGPVNKETDPAKIEQKRQQEAQQYERERQPPK